MYVADRVVREFGSRTIAGTLEGSPQMGYCIPLTKYREQELFTIFQQVKTSSSEDRTFSAKPYRDEAEKYPIPVFSREEAEELHRQDKEIPLTAGKSITISISRLKSTFVDGRKVWRVILDCPAINELRLRMQLPAASDSSMTLYFATRDQTLPLERHITKSKNQVKVLSKLADLPSSEFSPKALHAAVEKEWLSVASLMQAKGIIPYLRTARAWSENKELMEAYNASQEALEAHYQVNPSSVDVADIFSKRTEGEVLLAIQQLPMRLLTADHIHKAVKTGFYQVVDYLDKQSIAPYRNSYTLMQAIDPLLAQSMKLCFQAHQRQLSLAMKRKEQKVDGESILRHLASEDEAYEELCKIPVDELSSELHAIAGSKNWTKIQQYLVLQGFVVNEDSVRPTLRASSPIPIAKAETPSRVLPMTPETLDDEAEFPHFCGSPARVSLATSWGSSSKSHSLGKTTASVSKVAQSAPRGLLSSSVPTTNYFAQFEASRKKSLNKSSGTDE